MALSNMSFTNSIGTISMSRIMYTLGHKYVWKGTGTGSEVLTVTVNGWLKTTDSDLLTGLSSNDYSGNSGTLILPSATYANMYLRSISHSDGFWNQWGQASVTFDNDGNDFLSTYAITWFGYTLYAPKISITPSIIKRSETMVQNLNGWLRQQLGHEMFKMIITGTYICANTSVPTGLLSALEKRYMASGALFPSGYPYVFDLIEAVPQVAGNLEVHECIVTRATAEWHVNEKFVNVNIELTAPPQLIG